MFKSKEKNTVQTIMGYRSDAKQSGRSLSQIILTILNENSKVKKAIERCFQFGSNIKIFNMMTVILKAPLKITSGGIYNAQIKYITHMPVLLTSTVGLQYTSTAIMFNPCRIY